MQTAAEIIILSDRLAQITALHGGWHRGIDEGVCAMEAAAYIAGKVGARSYQIRASAISYRSC